jgi:hypothetical protein
MQELLELINTFNTAGEAITVEVEEFAEGEEATADGEGSSGEAMVEEAVAGTSAAETGNSSSRAAAAGGGGGGGAIEQLASAAQEQLKLNGTSES